MSEITKEPQFLIEGTFTLGESKKRIHSNELWSGQFFLSIQKKEFEGEMNCYVLGRRLNNSLDVVMLKSIRDENEFDLEIEMVKKIFNPILL